MYNLIIYNLHSFTFSVLENVKYFCFKSFFHFDVSLSAFAVSALLFAPRGPQNNWPTVAVLGASWGKTILWNLGQHSAHLSTQHFSLSLQSFFCCFLSILFSFFFHSFSLYLFLPSACFNSWICTQSFLQHFTHVSGAGCQQKMLKREARQLRDRLLLKTTQLLQLLDLLHMRAYVRAMHTIQNLSWWITLSNYAEIQNDLRSTSRTHRSISNSNGYLLKPKSWGLNSEEKSKKWKKRNLKWKKKTWLLRNGKKWKESLH